MAYRFDNVTRRQNTSRAEGSSYPQDPDCRSSLPANAFAATGYDHGHICASADRLYSSQANEQTFYMTNMSPQIPNFNRGYWRGYESFVQSLPPMPHSPIPSMSSRAAPLPRGRPPARLTVAD